MHCWLMQENLKWMVEANLKRICFALLSLDSFMGVSNHLTQFDTKLQVLKSRMVRSKIGLQYAVIELECPEWDNMIKIGLQSSVGQHCFLSSSSLYEHGEAWLGCEEFVDIW